MKPKSFLAKSIATILATSVTLTTALHALPLGEQVRAGSATFDRTGAALNISTSDRAIIDYRSFNIAGGERVNFIQPSAMSITLNRVTDPNPSHIFGTLQSNGKIVLANPYGIFFESGSVVNVGGLIAGAGRISDSDFLSGRMNFTSLSGDVENRGNIIAINDVALYGAHVSNEGVISSQKGSVTLAAGSSVYVGEKDGNIFVGSAAAIPKARVVSRPGVSNSGSISAPKASLVAGDMYGIAIAQSGNISSGDITITAGAGGSVDVSGRLDASNRAPGKTGGKIKVKGDTVTVRAGTIDASGDAGGGTIILDSGHNSTTPTTVTSSGTITARGEGRGAKGGTVQVLGDHVGLFDQAIVDVSGDAGGGVALIGGDFQGKNPDVHNASRTYISLDAQIRADALSNGNGGKVIVWADEWTKFYGSISARGGAVSGDGGFAEVSGKANLMFRGSVNLTSASGSKGTLLLDPRDLVIQGGATNADGTDGTDSTLLGTDDSPNQVLFSENAGAVTTITESGLEALAIGSNVELQAGHSITTTGVFTLGLTFTANTNVTLRTRNNVGDDTGSAFLAGIDLSAVPITLQGSGSLTINTNDSGAGAGSGGTGGTNPFIKLGTITTDTGGVTANTGGGTGAITLNNNITTAGQDISLTGPVIIAEAAAPTLSTGAGAGNIGITGTTNGTTGGVAESLTVLAGTGNVTFTGNVGNNANATELEALTITSGATTLFGGTLDLANALTQNAGSGTTTLTGAASAGSVNLTANAGIVVSSTLVVTGGGALRLTSNSIDLNGGANSITGTGTVLLQPTTDGTSIGVAGGAGTLQLTAADIAALANGFSAITVGRAGGTGVTTVNAVTFNDPVTIQQPVGAIVVNGQITGADNASVSLISGVGGITLNNNITTAGQDILLTGPVIIAEAAAPTLSTGAGAGNILITGTTNGTTGGAAESLTVLAGTGNVTFTGNVGNNANATELEALTITSGATTLFGGTLDLANALTQNAGSVATTFAGAVSVGSAALTGAAFNVNNSFASGGTTVFTNAGVLTKNATGAITSAGAFSATGDVNLAANLTTTNADLTIGGNLVIAEVVALTLSTGAGAGNILITGTTNGTTGGVAESLTVLAGTGNVTFTGNVGNNANATELEALTITSGATTLFSGTLDLANALTQNAGSVATTFAGAVSVGSAALTGTAFNVNNSFASGGTTVFTNAGVLTKNATGAITSTGAFSATGDMNLAANLTTVNADLTIGGNLVIAEGAAPTLSTGAGAGNIGITGTSNGTTGGVAESLTVLAGTGNVTFTGNVGNNANTTELEALTITSGATTLFSGTLDLANALTQNAGSVATTFAGAVSVGSAALTGTAFNVNNSFASGGTTVFTNTGVLTKNATGAITSTGAFSTTGNVNLAANITTTNADLTIGGNLVIAEAAAPTLSTGAGAGNIGITGTTNGTTGGVAESLTVLAGTGNVTFTGNVGNNANATELEALTITSGATTLFGGTLDLANALTQNAGSVATTFAGAVSVGSAALTGTAFNVNNSFASGGTTVFTNAGVLTKNATGAITSTGAFSTTGDVNLAANITTANADLTIGGNLVIAEAAAPTLSTGAGAGNIGITGTTNGTTGGVAESLTVLAGTGNVTFTGNVGNNANATELEALTITSGATTLFGGTLDLANALTQNAGSGTTTLTGAASAGSVNLTANAGIVVSSTLVVTGGGALRLTSNSIDLNGGANSITGTGTVLLQPTTDGTSIGVAGGAGTLQLTAADIAALANGFSAITVGRAGGTGVTTVNAVTFNDPVTIQQPVGAIVVNGQITGADNASVSLISGVGGITLNNNITTAGQDILLTGPVIIAEAAAPTLSTGAGAGNILITGTTNGTTGGAAESLTVLAGTGNVTFTGNVGNNANATELEALTITSGATTLFGGTLDLANALTQNAGSVATTFAGAVSVGSAALTGAAFNVNNSFASGGTTVFTNAGVLTKNATGAITSAGAFSATGDVNLAANLTTTNADLTIGGNLVIAEVVALTLSTGAGAGNILITGTTNGTTGGVAESLTVLAGTGNVTFTGNVGNNANATELEALTITSGATTLFSGTLDLANALTQNAGSVATTFAGAVSVGSAALTGTAFNVNNSFASGGTTVFTNAGVLTKNATGAITSTGAFSATGDMNLAANLTTVNADLTIGGNLVIAEGAAPTLSTGAGAGNIGITGTSNGTTGGVAESLTVLAGTGNVTFTGNVGNNANTTELEALTITSGATTLFSGTLDLANALTQNAGSVATTFAGAVSVGSAALTGTAFNVNNSFASGGTTVFTNTGVLTKNATGAITSTGAFSTTGNVNLAANITTTNADLTIGGNLVIAEAAAPTLSTGAGAGNIGITGTTNGTTGGVAESLTVLAGTGNVTFTGNVGNNANATELEALTITSGATTLFGGTLDLANALTQNAGSVATTFAGAVSVGSAALTGTAFNVNNSFASGGTTVFTNAGVLTKNATGAITSTGAFSTTGDVNLAANITTANADLTIGGNLVIAEAAAPTLSTGAGAGNIGITGTTNGTTGGVAESLTVLAGTGNVTFTGNVGNNANATELEALTITSGATTLFGGTLDLANALTQNAGSVATTFNGGVSVGSAALTGTAFNVNNSFASGGTTVFTNAGVLTKNATGAITSTGAFSTTGDVNLAANITTTNADLTIGGNLVIAEAVALTLSTGAGAGNIGISGTTNGTTGGVAESLTLTAGTGNITFTNSVGATTRLGAVLINSATDVNINNSFTVASLVQSAGSGTTTINGALSTNAAGGVSLTGNNQTLNSTITTEVGSGGTVTFTNNAGTLTLAGSINSDGEVKQNGSGPVRISGARSITTTGDAVSFATGVTLANPSSLTIDTTNAGGSAAGAGVTFASTLDGTTAGLQNLTVNAGTGGTVLFTGAVGGAARLGDILITNAQNVTESAGITARTLTQAAGSALGVTLLNGPVNTSGVTGTGDGVSLTTAGPITQNSTMTTGGGGKITLVNGGVFTMNGNIASDGAVAQTGAGAVTVTGTRSITTTGDAVSFATGVTLANLSSLTIDTTNAGGSAAGGGVTFATTLDGTTAGLQNLTVNAGTGGTVLFTGAVGAPVRLGDILIVNAQNVTESAGITATSLTQAAGTAGGLTRFDGAVNTNGVNPGGDGVSLTTAGAITVNNAVTTTNVGKVTLANGQLLTLNGDIVSDGAVAQTGAGLVSVTGTRSITTTGDAVSFAGGVTLANPSSLTIDTTNAGGSVAGAGVTFTSTLDGTTAGLQNLTVNAGTGGTVLFTGAVGGAVRLGDILITNAQNVTESAGITARTLTQAAGSALGVTLLNGPVNTSGVTGTGDGISLTTAGPITQNSTMTTGGGGKITLVNGGVFTMNGNIASDGAVAQTGAGAVTVTGIRTVTTTGDTVNFASALTLANPGSLSVDTSSGAPLGAGITFASPLNGTVAGAQNLSVNAGSGGLVLFSGSVGAGIRLGTVTVTNSGGVTFASTVAASAVALTNTTAGNTVAFQNNLDVSSGMTVAGPTAYNVSILGANNSIAGTTIFNNTGTLTLGDGGDLIAFTGGVVATAPSAKIVNGTVSAAGTGVINLGVTAVNVTGVSTVGGASTGLITMGNATLSDGVMLTVGTGVGAPVNMGSVIGTAGGAAETLIFNTLGAVNVAGTVGSVLNPLDQLTVMRSDGATFADTVNARTVTLTDTTAGNTISFQDDLSVITGMTVAAGTAAYNVSITGGADTIAGTTIFNNTGTVTLGDASADILTFTAGVAATVPAVTLAGTVRSAGGAGITLGSPTTAVTIAGTTATLDTTNAGATPAGANIQVNGAVDGTVANAQSLSLSSGAAGVITFTPNAPVGQAIPLGTVAVTNSNTVNFLGAVTATTLSVSGTVVNVNSTGTGGTIANAFVPLNTGVLTLGQLLGTQTFSGGLNTTGVGGVVTVCGTVNTTNTALTLGAVTLGCDTVLNTNATTTAGDITLGAVTGAGFNLTLQTGAGVAGADVNGTSVAGVGTLQLQNIGGTAAFTGAVNAATFNVPATVVNVSSTGTGGTITNAFVPVNTGTLTLGQAGGTQTFTGGLNTTGVGGLVTVNGTVNTTNTALTLGAVTLGSNTVLNSNAVTTAGDITLGAVTGAGFNLTLQTGAGVAGADVNGTSVSGLGTLQLQNIGGTASFTGAVNAATFNVPATVVNVSSTGTGGTITNAFVPVNTGTLTLGQAGGTQTFTGGLNTTGVGGLVTVNGTILTNGGPLTLGAVNLTQNTILATTNGFPAGAPLTIGAVTGNTFTLALDAGTLGTIAGTSVDNVSLLTITNSAGTTFTATIGGTVAGAANLVDSTGTIAFQGNTHFTTLTTASKGYNVAFTGTANTVDNAATFLNTGTLRLGDGAPDTIAFTSGVVATSQTGTTAGILLNGTVSAAGTGVITLGDLDTGVSVSGTSLVGGASTGLITMGNVLLADGVTLTVGTGVATPINLSAVSGTAGGASSSLNINTMAAANIAGVVGNDIGTLTVVQSGGTSFQSAVTAGTIAILNTLTGQTVAFQGNTNANTGMTVAAGTAAYNVSLTGGANTIAGTTTFNNTGTATLGDQITDTLAFTGGVVAIAPSAKNLAGTVSAAGVGVINLGVTPVNVTDTTTVGGISTGLITLGNATIANAKTLTLGTGVGTPISTGSIDNTTLANSSNVTFNTAGIVTVNGPVGATQPLNTVTVMRSGGATFASTVRAATIAILDTVGGQTVAFQGNTNATTGMTVAAGSGAYNVSLTGAANTIAGLTTFNNAGTVTLGDQSIDALAFTAGVVATAPSAKNIAGTISAGTGVINLGVTPVNVTDSATVGGASTGQITLGNATIANGKSLTVGTGIANAINLGSVIGSAAVGAETLTINTTGVTNVAGAVGAAANQLDQLTVTNSDDATFLSTVDAKNVAIANATAGKTVAFNDNLTVSNGMTVGAGTGAYNVSITGGTNTIAGNTTFNNTGTVTLGDQTTDISTFQAGVVATASAVNMAGRIQTNGVGAASFGAAPATRRVLLTRDTMISTGAGAVTFGGSVFGGFALTVSSSGNTTFAQPVGIRSLVTDGGGTTILPSLVTTVGNQNYFDALALAGDTTLGSSGGGAINLFSTVNSPLSALAVSTSGTLLLGGTVYNLSGLNPQVSGVTTIGTSGSTTKISVPGDLIFPGPVVVLGSVTIDPTIIGTTSQISNNGATMQFLQSVDGPGSLTVSSGGPMNFAGGVGLQTALDSLSATAPIITLNSTKTLNLLRVDAVPAATTDGSDGLLNLTGGSYSSISGSVQFNPTNRTLVSKHATILSTVGDLSISAAGAFFMGNEQKLLVNAGALMLVAGSSATVGDMAAFTRMSVTASSVLLQGRALNGFFNSNRKDNGLGFVSPTINFTTNSMSFVSGTTQKAVFSTRDSIASVRQIAGVSLEIDKDIANQFGKQDLAVDSQFQPVVPNIIYGTVQPIASGTRVTEPGQIQVIFVLEIPKLVELPQDTFLSKSVLDVLARMGIYPRDATSDENITVSLRRGVFRQPIEGKAEMEDPEYMVVVNRLTTEEVTAIVDAYEQLAGKDFSNIDKIATTLGEEIEKFKTETPDAIGLEGFTKWLQAQRNKDKSAEELAKNLDELSSVFVQLARIGLTKKEVAICKLKICALLKAHTSAEVWDIVPLVEGAASPKAPRPAMTAPPPDLPPPASTPPAEVVPPPLPPAPEPPPAESATVPSTDAPAGPVPPPLPPPPDASGPGVPAPGKSQ